MRHLGLFSGIGGFESAFRRVGAELIAACEIEPSCQQVLRRQFSGAEIINDVKEITGDRIRIKPDVITGGFPCQDLSVAGRRAGLVGERSGLWFELIRIIAESQPRWVVIENVPGLLSSNGGRDFAVILHGLVECGYGVAWRVLDSQYTGVAQRRERVFIVASLGSQRCAEVLFERDGSAWDSPPRREAGQGVAALTANGVGTCGADDNQAQAGHLVVATLTSNGDAHSGFRLGDGLVVAHRMTAFGEYVEDGTSSTLKQRDYKDATDLVVGSFGVRRLTPTECERLQGYPDGWTAFGDNGKQISDSARYRMLGNAVTEPVVAWIARRIQFFDFIEAG